MITNTMHQMSVKSTLLVFLFVTSFAARAQESGAPLFSFGLIADVQYADVDASGKRDYRGSPERLKNALKILNAHNLSFTVHAGDLIDRYYGSFNLPLRIFEGSRAPVYYVVGNHEFSVADSLKDRVRGRINNPAGYHSFRMKGVRFIIVDAMDVSVHSSVKGSKAHQKATAIQDKLKIANANNSYDWNGGFGRRQLKWLKKELRRAGTEGERVVLFSHHPLLPENGLQAWNNREVLELLDSSPAVVAFISGHHHEGGYVRAGRIHHVTLKGLVEATSETACGIADVYADRIVIRGFGDQVGYVLE